MVTRLLPSEDGCVDMEAESLRNSFHRRPSWRSSVDAYVELVSRGIVMVLFSIIDCEITVKLGPSSTILPMQAEFRIGVLYKGIAK